jgi:Second Messenger Oligonucleotide or Dinucleotide Synthetase domain
MTAIPSYFTDFLTEIRLTDPLQASCEQKHLQLNNFLQADAELSKVIIDTFLQGSYRRHTAVRPLDPDDRSEHVDVDLVVVTTLDPATNSPDRVVARFTPFLDRHFKSHWSSNDRSIKIDYDDTSVTLDLVVTAAPSLIVEEVRKAAELGRARGFVTLSERRPGEVRDIMSFREAVGRVAKAAGFAEWRDEALLIPDRKLTSWVKTHPVEQIAWTEGKNGRTAGHYVNVVKALKWWRRRHDDPEYPKGYPLEHLVGTVCPDGIGAVAEGLTLSLEAIVRAYQMDVLNGRKPELPDHGVPEHDVFRRVTPNDFGGFYRLVQSAADLARQALNAPTVAESASRWRELLGPEFPEPLPGNFSKRTAASTIASTGRFG